MERFKTILHIILLLLLVSVVKVSAQDAVPLDKPRPGKSLVYIFKGGFGGALINFNIYDGEKSLGDVSVSRYIVYHCEPGEHKFWANSENRSYLVANLEPDKVYAIGADSTMGFMVAQVNLRGYDPKIYSDRMMFHQVVKNGKKNYITGTTLNSSEDKNFVSETMKKYDELIAKQSKNVHYLTGDMSFDNADKPVKEKKSPKEKGK